MAGEGGPESPSHATTETAMQLHQDGLGQGVAGLAPGRIRGNVTGLCQGRQVRQDQSDRAVVAEAAIDHGTNHDSWRQQAVAPGVAQAAADGVHVLIGKDGIDGGELDGLSEMLVRIAGGDDRIHGRPPCLRVMDRYHPSHRQGRPSFIPPLAPPNVA